MILQKIIIILLKPGLIKWFREGKIIGEISELVTGVEPKSGVTYMAMLKPLNKCCGTAIERLSEKLPSFVKDTTNLIKKIEKVNSNFPLIPF